MNSRDYYTINYNRRSDDGNSLLSGLDSQDGLDNVTEFNANQFKLFDDFTTDLRIVNFTKLRAKLYQETLDNGNTSKVADPNDSGVDMENGNPLDNSTATSNDTDLVSLSLGLQLVEKGGSSKFCKLNTFL